jgi:hypothetical protein
MEGNHALRKQSDEIGLALRRGGLGYKLTWDGPPKRAANLHQKGNNMPLLEDSGHLQRVK